MILSKFAPPSFQVMIPSSIPSGSYIMRHEVMNLGRVTMNSAIPSQPEGYPSCFQLNVTGGGSDVLSPSFYYPGSIYLARFPGAYKATDAGLNYDPYARTDNYTFPGPPIPSVLSNGNTSSTTATTTTTTTTSVAESTSNAHHTSTTYAPSSGKPCIIMTTITKVMILTMALGIWQAP
jgi:hypothetical protein